MLSDKKLSKIEKTLGESRMEDMKSASKEDLEALIVVAASAIQLSKDQLEANPRYQEAKDVLKDLSQSYRDLKKYQNAIIQYSLSLLEDLGAK